MQKRQRLSDGSPAKPTVSSTSTRSCQNLAKLDYSVDSPALDLVISDKFLEITCPCDHCLASFAKIKKLVQAIDNRDEALKDLENNLEGEVNNEGLEESKDPTGGSARSANNSINQLTSEINPELAASSE